MLVESPALQHTPANVGDPKRQKPSISGSNDQADREGTFHSSEPTRPQASQRAARRTTKGATGLTPKVAALVEHVQASDWLSEGTRRSIVMLIDADTARGAK